MKKTTDIITDEMLNKAWGNADFGTADKRDVLANALLKYASGYCTGHTAQCIAEELGLVIVLNIYECELSSLGKQYLYAAYSNGLSV